MINIYLIRHGQSWSNANTKDVIGQPDDGVLTDLGIKQAECLAAHFVATKIHFNEIYSSTFARAVQTAKILKEKADIKPHIKYTNALVEYSPGDFRGKNRIDILNKYAIPMSILNMGFKIPNGETLHRAERRASAWLEEIIIYNESVLALDNPNIAIVSHGVLIKTLLHYVMNFAPQFCWAIKLYNTGVCKLQYHPLEGWQICSINDIAHLKSY
jgi:broad specificity phosphatase PhoE